MTDEERAEMAEALARAMATRQGVATRLAYHWREYADTAADLMVALAPLIAARERAAAEAMRWKAAKAAMGCPDYVWGSWCADIIDTLPLPGTKSAQPETDKP